MFGGNKPMFKKILAKILDPIDDILLKPFKININDFCVEKRPSLEDRLFTFKTPNLVKGVNTPKKIIGNFFKTPNSVKGPKVVSV